MIPYGISELLSKPWHVMCNMFQTFFRRSRRSKIKKENVGAEKVHIYVDFLQWCCGACHKINISLSYSCYLIYITGHGVINFNIEKRQYKVS